MIKEQLKESLDEIEKLHKKILELSKHPDDTTFLKDSIIHQRSRIDMFMANEMFGDDLEPICDDEITNLATQASTKRRGEQNYGSKLNPVKKSLKTKVDVEKDLEPFESRTYQQIMVDVQKIKSLKEAYPEEYKAKLETNQDLLQKKIKSIQKEMNDIRKENVQLRDTIEMQKNNYEKVLHTLEKCRKLLRMCNKAKIKEESSFGDEGNNQQLMRQEIETEFQHIRSNARRSHLIETFKKVDATMEKFGKKNEVSKLFHDLSSIVVDPNDLPKDFKMFAMDTVDSKAQPEISIPSTYIKKPQTAKNLNIKAAKGGQVNESSRRDEL